MTLYLQDAELEVYKPGASTPHITITKSDADIKQIEYRSRIQDRKDTATIRLYNNGGKYSGEITRGDKLVFTWTESSGATATDTRYGHFHYGEAQVGGHGGLRSGSWTGMVTGDIQISELPGNELEMTVPGADFVFAVLSDRIVHNDFEATQISGTADSIVNTVLDNKAPEIDRSGIATITDTTDAFADGTNLLEFLVDIARDADAVMSADGETLNFEPMVDIDPQFEMQSNQYGTSSVNISDDGMRNDLRVDGGTDYDKDESQETQSSYTTVTDSSRITYQLSTRKARLDNIEIWTNPTGSEESITVRFQKDSGGAPIAIDDASSDVENKTLSHEFLADDDYTTFLLSDEHTFPEPAPWLIIESGGGTGQDIGVDGNGDPTFKSFYQFPVAVQVDEQSSIDSYRRIEDVIGRDNLNTQAAARALGDAALAHDSEPEREWTGLDALSPRTHRLHPGQVIDTDFPELTVTGEYICTERSQTYDGIRLETTLEFQEVATF